MVSSGRKDGRLWRRDGRRTPRGDIVTRVHPGVDTDPPGTTPLILAVVSGKGGVGKTTLSVNLACALTRRGITVLLVDADFGMAGADLMLGVTPHRHLGHVFDGVCTLEEAIVEVLPGLGLIGGASGWDRETEVSTFELALLMEQVRRLRYPADIVILDAGAGVSRQVWGPACAADRVWVVTTPEPTAMTDAYVMIKTLHRHRAVGRVSLFENLVDTRADAAQTYQRIADVASRFLGLEVENAGYCPGDPAVMEAVRRRTPVVIRDAGCAASVCFGHAADQLLARLGARTVPEGLVRRIVGLFL